MARLKICLDLNENNLYSGTDHDVRTAKRHAQPHCTYSICVSRHILPTVIRRYSCVGCNDGLSRVLWGKVDFPEFLAHTGGIRFITETICYILTNDDPNVVVISAQSSYAGFLKVEKTTLSCCP